MRLFSKMILIILITVFFIQELLYANEENKYKFLHPTGLEIIKFNIGSSEQNKNKSDISNYWLNSYNLRKFAESEMKSWMEEVELDYNENNLDKVTEGIHRCVKKMWRDAGNKLFKCETFNNHYNGKTKKNFLENLAQISRPILFKPGDAQFDITTVAALDAWNSNMWLHLEDLEKIVKYYSKKILNGDSDISDFNNENENKDFFELTGFIGLEMLHLFGGLESISYGKMTSESIKNDCEAHCLQGKCLDPNHGQKMSECDGDDNDMFCDPEKKCEFKKCSGTSNQPPPIGGTSTISNETTRYAKVYLPDTPDDHYSYSDLIAFSDNDFSSNAGGSFFGDTFKEVLSFSYYPDILIYSTYGNSLMENLLTKIMPGKFIDDYDHDYFSKNHKILVLPSVSAMGDFQSNVIKNAITQFLKDNKSVVVFSQQFGKDFKNIIPMPEGEIGTITGFRQDQSCLKHSIFFTEMHPILSSSTSGVMDVGVDGYFTVNSDSNATVLLRRKINDEPVLLYYKMGQSTIFLLSTFTDYASSRSIASVQEIKLIKNLLRFAMDPDSSIPMFNLDENSNPTINLNIHVTNHAETTAAKAKLFVYTIENTPVYQAEYPVSLNHEDSIDIPISFTLPDMEIKDYGIGFTLFQLEDAEGNIIQTGTETPTGRFSIYKLITPADINGGLFQWITLNDEVAYWGQEIACTIHYKNASDETKYIDVKNPYFYIDHGSSQIYFKSFSAVLNPGETYEHTAYLPTTQFSQWDSSKVTFRILYHDEEGKTKQIGAAKAVYIKKPMTKSSLKLNTSNPVPPASPLNYTIYSEANENPVGESTIKVTLERYDEENSGYSEIKVLFQENHDYSVNRGFQYTGTYTPETVHPSGNYRLKLEVIAPNDVKELARYQDFYYDRSGFHVDLGSVNQNGLPRMWLTPGESYTIPVYIKNSSSSGDYHVTNGRCTIRIISPSLNNQEIFRKELTGMAISPGEQLTLEETFVFNPVGTGDNFIGICL